MKAFNSKMKKDIVIDFKNSIYEFLYFSMLRGINIVRIDFVSDVEYGKSSVVQILGLDVQLKTMEFEILYCDKKRKNSKNYVCILGFRSIIGYNNKLTELLKVFFKHSAQMKSVKASELMLYKNMSESLKKNFNRYNEDTFVKVTIFNDSKYCSNLIDRMAGMSIVTCNAYYNILGSEYTLAEKLLLTKVKEGEVVFLNNYINLSKKKSIDINRDWEDIIKFMSTNFPLETMTIDTFNFKMKCLKLSN